MNRLDRRKQRLINEIAERVTQKLLREEYAAPSSHEDIYEIVNLYIKGDPSVNIEYLEDAFRSVYGNDIRDLMDVIHKFDRGQLEEDEVLTQIHMVIDPDHYIDRDLPYYGYDFENN
jgi:hypothetical protein